MTQIFHPSATTLARSSIAVLLLLIGVGALSAFALTRSQFVTKVGFAIEQPVPFSHEHHVAGLGIDCRFCHTAVEDSSFAGMPPTETCMHCHSQIWDDSPMLAPVRESWRTGVPIAWRRVHNLPDFAHFPHNIHVSRGIGCTTCHGQVDQMPLIAQAETLYMKWCLDCHRRPEDFVRPLDEVFSVTWRPPADQRERGRELAEIHGIDVTGITNCSACHY